MRAHFVTFYSPGTFVAEDTTKPIESWSVPRAVEMAKEIVERCNARPYCFRFTTRARGPKDLDSKVVRTSRTYFLGGKIESLADVEARGKADETLASNMRCNGWSHVYTTTKGWKWSQTFDKKRDVHLPEAGGGPQTTEPRE